MLWTVEPLHIWEIYLDALPTFSHVYPKLSEMAMLVLSRCSSVHVMFWLGRDAEDVLNGQRCLHAGGREWRCSFVSGPTGTDDVYSLAKID